MVIYCTADLHLHLPEIPECDVLLIAGDIVDGFALQTLNQQQLWMVTTFRKWLNRIPAKRVIFTPGNHDFIYQATPEAEWPKLRMEVLIDQALTLETDGGPIKVYGTPWQIRHGDWAFNYPKDAMNDIWKKIPDDTNILLCHQPPGGICDVGGRGDHLGCFLLTKRIEEIKPKLVVCGHIHPAYGEYPQKYGTLVVNAAYVGAGRDPKNKPVRVDYWLI